MQRSRDGDPPSPGSAPKNVISSPVGFLFLMPTCHFSPDDHSRVHLTPVEGVPDSDYINASFINVSGCFPPEAGPGHVCGFYGVRLLSGGGPSRTGVNVNSAWSSAIAQPRLFTPRFPPPSAIMQSSWGCCEAQAGRFGRDLGAVPSEQRISD